ncbi:alpha/beta hydrolase [Streptomyces sp. NPDC086033]|uniref:alpha/beta hydrolase n=1 Tax=Streptomyces sp. NPDC086033 TaxID=3365747 RepID=UPI0037D906AC
MPIDPDLQPLLPFGHSPKVIEDPELFRARTNQNTDDAFDTFGRPGPPVGERRLLNIGPGDESVRAILYRPDTAGPHPVHVFLHGGGWVINSAFSKDSEAVSRHRSVHADCIVISVDYRKAPEHPFPAPVHDVVSIIDWVNDNTAEIGALPGAITVGGQSSGANIAAGATLLLRDQGRDDISFQLLEVPVLDLTHSRPREEGDELPLSMTDVRTFCALYVGDGGDRHDPIASPLLARDLTGLPAAYIANAEYDVLRGDGEWYAQRLREAHVPVELFLGEGHVHVSPNMTGLLASARAWQEASTSALRTANSRLRDPNR